MGLFDKVKKTTIESRRYEEKLYEVALEEVEAGDIRKGLYAKAVAKADGIYLKLRVQSIMDDIESEQIDRRDNERAYKALQEIQSERIPNITPLETECRDILSTKGFTLHKPTFGKYKVKSQDNQGLSVYSSKNLNDIKHWAELRTT